MCDVERMSCASKKTIKKFYEQILVTFKVLSLRSLVSHLFNIFLSLVAVLFAFVLSDSYIVKTETQHKNNSRCSNTFNMQRTLMFIINQSAWPKQMPVQSETC